MAYSSTSSCQLRGLLSILIILASVLVAGSAEEPPSHYRVELTHVDANGGFTRGELIHRAVHRTHLRAATLSAPRKDSAASTYTSTAHYSDHEYLVDLEIGTPPERFQAILDTGSRVVVLTNLSLCNTTSSSFAHAKCPQSQSQTQSAEPTYSTCCGGLLMFKKTYGGTRIMQGFMGTETLSFISAATTPKPIHGVLVGCTIYTDCGGDRLCPKFPMNASGIFGLGRGPDSLVQQHDFHKFSYCLNDQLKPDLKSLLLLGDGPPLTTTGSSESMLHTTKFNTLKYPKYYVQLCDISIGEPDEHKKCEVEDMLVDSGTSYTYLQPDAFNKVNKTVAKLFNKGASKSDPLSCYPADELKEMKQPMPEMILQFAGNAIMRLPWNNYMIKNGSDLCLAVVKNTKNTMVILGNFQQQNMKMFYDLDKGELSFVPTVDCTSGIST